MIPAIWLAGVVLAVLSGFYPDPYLEAVGRSSPHPAYPLASVAWAVAFLTLDAALLGAILRPASYRLGAWRRAGGAFVVATGFLSLGVMGSMHAPNPFAVALMWSLLAALVTMCLLLAAITATFMGLDGWGGPADRRAPPSPADGFGSMLWLIHSLPPEGFVAHPFKRTHPRPRLGFHFAPTARREHAQWLVETVNPGQALEFFDTRYPSVSDPGGFVTAVRSAHESAPGSASATGPWYVHVTNHGWHTGWEIIDADTLAAYLWECHASETPAGPEPWSLSTGPAAKVPVDTVPAPDPDAPVRRAIENRLRAGGERA